MSRVGLVVTTVQAPNKALSALAEGARRRGVTFIAIGDRASPPGFELPGCRFYALEAQERLPFAYARACPAGHYARKNIGYLLALADGAEIVMETDDDNLPCEGFWAERKRITEARLQTAAGWTNVYAYFSDDRLWPRGFPLERVTADVPVLSPERHLIDAPIQQGLADGDPDVDAVHRLTVPARCHSFRPEAAVALAQGAWCPFNSQNTAWWRVAAPLLYLPSHCPMRMTDIWRSLVAQRIAWQNGWKVLFHAPTVFQERNPHDLLSDFRDELSGYLENARIADLLGALALAPGEESICESLRVCYEALVAHGVFPAAELPLLDSWISDVSDIMAAQRSPARATAG